MSDRYETYIQPRETSKTVNEGLRKYMLSVYNYMAMGVALTGLVSWIVANIPALSGLLYTVNDKGYLTHSILGWIVTFAPLAFVFIFAAKIATMKARSAQIAFFAFSALMGASIAHIFFVYSGQDITRVFFITSATFAGMSLYGYTTKRDLTGMGHFLIMGVWGLLVVGLVNIFLQSPVVSYVYSLVGLFLFIGLTAFDTQKIRNMYNANDAHSTMTKKAIYGAFELYIDFINMFLFLLRLMGGNRD